MNYFKIDNCNMNNGDGLRCVVWVSGCTHHCKGCFNPETWDSKNGAQWGEEQTNFVLETLKQDWCSGITFTGGDPLFHTNIETIQKLCILIKNKFPQKTIWVYTGNRFEDIPKVFLQYIDVIADGTFEEHLKSPDKHWVGSSNQRVIDVCRSLIENKTVLYG